VGSSREDGLARGESLDEDAAHGGEGGTGDGRARGIDVPAAAGHERGEVPRAEGIERDLRLPRVTFAHRGAGRAPIGVGQRAPGVTGASQGQPEGSPESFLALTGPCRPNSPQSLEEALDRRISSRDAEGGRLDDRQGAHRSRASSGRQERHHAAVRVADEMGRLVEQTRDVDRIGLEIDPAWPSRTGSEATSIDEAKTIPLGEGSLRRERLAPPAEAAMDQDDEVPSVAPALDVEIAPRHDASLPDGASPQRPSVLPTRIPFAQYRPVGPDGRRSYVKGWP